MNDKIKVIVVTDGERPYRYLISAEKYYNIWRGLLSGDFEIELTEEELNEFLKIEEQYDKWQEKMELIIESKEEK